MAEPFKMGGLQLSAILTFFLAITLLTIEFLCIFYGIQV